MLGPSLKSVPGCLVSIVPMLIGVPVAFWPGLGPHFDVSAEPPLELELELDDELDPPLAAAELLELLLELPHPVRIAAPTIAAINAATSRACGECSCVLTISPPRVIRV
jgi:1-acyl-sn-glycerol-3-phosphate acyltransferase